jgi:hypothetical protein
MKIMRIDPPDRQVYGSTRGDAGITVHHATTEDLSPTEPPFPPQPLDRQPKSSMPAATAARRF